MIRNERGFAYPLTFSMILLAALVLSIQINTYLSEVRLLKESEAIIKQEYYFLSSMKNVEKILQRKDEEFFSGSFTFNDGMVNYETSELSEGLYKISFTLRMENYPDIIGFAYFDVEAGKMTKWVERN